MSAEEKRKRLEMFDQEFYDKMMEIHSDMKHIVRWSEDHDEQDDIRFDEASKKIDSNTRYVYMGLGGLMVIQAFLHFIK